MTLQSLGWCAFFEAQLQNNALRPCRVVSEGTDLLMVHDGAREVLAWPRGRLRNQPGFPPVVGDWVLVECADDNRLVVESILKRRTAMVCKQAGSRASAQVLAANVDRVLLVTWMKLGLQRAAFGTVPSPNLGERRQPDYRAYEGGLGDENRPVPPARRNVHSWLPRALHQ